MKPSQQTTQLRTLLMVTGLFFVFAATACAPSTPTPVVTPTSGPTGQPTSQPIQNFAATEALIISHVFATMTASAPSKTRVAVTPAAATPIPVRATATATKPKVSVKATSTPAPVAPKPTRDPYLAQIPKGKGGILVVSYIGTMTNFTIPGAGCPNDGCSVSANGRRLIIVDPGTYNISVQVIGPPGGAWNDTVTVVEDRYVTYSLSIKQ